jgi:phosphotransferase system HPr (HPr) family protein
MSQSPPDRIVTVLNPEGLHARPADLIVRTANRFAATTRIAKAGETVDCKSILSLLTLGAAQGTELVLSASGPDAEQALEALCQLFESGFDDSSQIEGAQTAADS